MAGIEQQGFTASQPRFRPQALRKVLIANRGEIALRLVSSQGRNQGARLFIRQTLIVPVPLRL